MRVQGVCVGVVLGGLLGVLVSRSAPEQQSLGEEENGSSRRQLGASFERAAPPKIFPLRDERYVTVGRKAVSVMIQPKNVLTRLSPTMPNLEDAIELYDSITTSQDYEESRSTVLKLTRGLLVDWSPRWYEQIELPEVSDFVIHPPPNQTSVCSTLELFEVYLNAHALDVPFSRIERKLRKELSLLNDFVQLHQDELADCLADRVDTIAEDGSLRYTSRTFAYHENFPGVQEGPLLSQFWLIPHLPHQSPRIVVPKLFLEEVAEDAGTVESFEKAQTRPSFSRNVGSAYKSAYAFAYTATAVHSDALMAESSMILDLLLTSNMVRFDCSRFESLEGESTAAQADFVTCGGCMSNYRHFFGATNYALLGAFTAKKKFNRLRPEQFAYRVALLRQSSCVSPSPEKFGASDLAEALPFFHETLESASPFLDRLAQIQDDCLLLRMLYPEGGPPHDSYPGGHSTYAGSSASVLSSMFCMYSDQDLCRSLSRSSLGRDESRPPELFPYSDLRVNMGVSGLSEEALTSLFEMADYGTPGDGNAVGAVWEAKLFGSGFVPTNQEVGGMTVWGEIVKFVSQYTHARDRAGVHYYSDGCAGLLLGEAMAIRYVLEDLGKRPRATVEAETIVKPLLDGRHVVLNKDGYRFWGEPDATPTMDVNEIVRTSPMSCAGSLPPLQLGSKFRRTIPESMVAPLSEPKPTTFPFDVKKCAVSATDGARWRDSKTACPLSPDKWVDDVLFADVRGHDSSEKFGVRCCSDDATTRPDSICNKRCEAVSYEEAVGRCENEGMRLCTSSELISGVAKGTGCSYDYMHSWTSPAGAIAKPLWAKKRRRKSRFAENGQNVKIDYAPLDTKAASTACCGDDDYTYYCENRKVDYETAERTCSERGMRVCSVADVYWAVELDSGDCLSSTKRYFWTTDGQDCD